MKKCVECESEKIIENANVFETDDGRDKSLNVAIDESPNAVFFTERNYSIVKADICADCGFVRMYARQAEFLWEAYLRQQENLPKE